MPEWLIERGIGETRAALVEVGRIVEARILVEGVIPAGTVLRARLIRTGRNAIAETNGQQFLLPRGASGITEGADLNIQITREHLANTETWKRPLAKVIDEPPHEATVLEGRDLQFPAATNELDDTGWPMVLDQARTGMVSFEGGELSISLTPAMTLIDIDGYLPPAKLALAGARAAAETIRLHGIGGSIGIDFPTVAGKAERQAIAEAVDSFLPQPFERTAVNGFGFLQIVRPRTRASLFELASERASFEARALLRGVAREIGAIRLIAHATVVAVLEANPTWIERLSRQVGGAVTLRADVAIPMWSGYAERA